MTTKKLYLMNPYVDVPKINVLEDSVFKLKINGAIHYTKAELIAKIDSIPTIGSETKLDAILRWNASLNSNIGQRSKRSTDSGSVLMNVNSYSDNICEGVSFFIYQMACLYFAEHYGWNINGGVTGYNRHSWNGFDDGFYDNMNKSATYKGAYEQANLAEVIADEYLYIEPLRINWLGHYTKDIYDALVQGVHEATNEGVAVRVPTYELVSDIDNLKMQMPAGSSFIFPVKSANALISEGDGSVIPTFAVMICIFPTGVTGSIEMPTNCINIKGAGQVIIEGNTFNLPADEAAIELYLQKTVSGSVTTPESNVHKTFTINTNTAGITAEFLVNRKTWLLFRNNEIEYEITSGSITIDRGIAALPLDTIIVSVDKGLSGLFTLNFDKWFARNKSFKLPKPYTTWDQRVVTFGKTDGKQPYPIYFNNSTVNSISKLTAGTPTIDKCFSAKLMPRQRTFVGTLELSFTIVDGSNCYYTVDGSTPDATKTLYAAPFTILATTTVKWINIKADYDNSSINSRVITKTA